jgi:hypothetical protein
MKTKNKTKILLLAILCLAIFVNFGNSKPDNSKPILNAPLSIKSAQEPFQLIQEFETSTYYLSPESSPGEKDITFFSFEANRGGNYTIEVTNYPTTLTQSNLVEFDSDFDNPNGTDDWIISYKDISEDNPINQNLKVLISNDTGKSWREYLVASVEAEGEELYEYYVYTHFTEVATTPNFDFIGVSSLLNLSDFKFFRSYDKGESWTGPFYIGNCSELGFSRSRIPEAEQFYNMNILKNGSIIFISETNTTDLTSLVYYQSNDNGTSWNGPFNISSIEGYDCSNPMMQVDYSSGKYWLMCKVFNETADNNYLRWINYTSLESLNKDKSSMLFDEIYYNISGAYDFFLGEGNYTFNVIQNAKFNNELSDLRHIYKSSSNAGASNESLGKNEPLSGISSGAMGFNAAFDGNNMNILFSYSEYTGTPEVYQYINFKNNTFWKVNGQFFPFQLKQVMWNGKINETIPINTSRVKVDFLAEEGLPLFRTIRDSLFLTIDNTRPSFDQYEQNRQYFNPQSANLSITEVPWDIIPSENVESILEVYQNETKNTLTSWDQATENNWEDSDPVIFTSDTGIIYILYQTIESGRKVLNLIRSEDKGISWSEPTSVYETYEFMEYYTGAAWGDIVCIYEKDESGSYDYLHRSFDRGESFHFPINISQTADFSYSDYKYIPRIVFAQNGTMFLTFVNNDHENFWLYSSENLGLSWNKVANWSFISIENYGDHLQPDLVYNPITNNLHLVMPIGNFSQDSAIFNFVTIDLGLVTSGAIFDVGPFELDYDAEFSERSDPKFIITKGKEEINSTIKTIFIQDFESGVNPVYKQMVSNNQGLTWSNYTDHIPLNYSSITSSIDGIYLAKDLSDGADFEIYFSRNTSLVRLQQSSISAHRVSEITFDGTNDFGDLLPEGNYTFKSVIRDDAYNIADKKGWFYIDYTNPNISCINTDEPYPLPSGNVQIQVEAVDNTDLTVYLYYQRYIGAWQSWEQIEMSYNGTHYIATINGNSSTTDVRYYVRGIDLAGNTVQDDNGGTYYEYHTPSFEFSSGLLFNEFSTYSSGEYHLISISITNDYENVKSVKFRYTTDAMSTIYELPMTSHSPEFTTVLPPLSGETRTLYYQIVVIDQNDIEHTLMDTRAVTFYPELPNFSLKLYQYVLVIIISAIVGVVLAIGYGRLKDISHEIMNKQQILALLSEGEKKKGSLKEIKNLSKTKRKGLFAKREGFTPYSIVYFSILCATLVIFSIGLLLSLTYASLGIVLIIGSLLLSIFGYMILMSRDISSNIFFEKMNLKNVILEIFQITLILGNIVAMIFVGSMIPWFNYYLLESTYSIGGLNIPKLYVSIIGVFLTSLILVIITTYIQLNKNVKNIHEQREQGVSDNLLLYTKDEQSSKLITRMGYKTVAFLISVLIAVITTTNLLNTETAILLAVVAGPFALSAILSLFLRSYLMKVFRKKEPKEIEIPFVDSKKYCSNCGEETYLQDRYCNNCGDQLIFENKMGVYRANCPSCNEYYYEGANYCTKCGHKLQNKK